MGIERYYWPIATDGTGLYNATSFNITGTLLSCFYDRGAGGTIMDVGTDITLADVESGTAILTLTNVATSGRYNPRAAAHDNVGAAIAGAYVPFPVVGQLRLTVTQGGASKVGRFIVFIDGDVLRI